VIASTVIQKLESSRADIPARLNLFLGCGYILLNVYQFIILPSCLLPLDVRWALTLVPLALLNNPFWSLIHEAIHDMFHPRQRLNLVWGRALSIIFGSPFRVLRSSHLLHHKLNRTLIEGTEYYDRFNASRWRASCGYYFQILGGLYLVEFLSPLPFYLPRRFLLRFKLRFAERQSISAILFQNWIRNDALREIRTDGLLTFGWFGVALFLYDQYWPLLLAVLLSRAFLISFLDNVYHYRTPVNEIFYAKNLWLGTPLAKTFLYFNLHGIHHKNPAIPWIRLPQVFQEQSQPFHGNYFSAAARQLSGPVALQDLPWAEAR
jgi:fatty acid desaturase